MPKFEIVKTTPVELSAVHINLIADAIRQIHTPDRAHREMDMEPAHILKALDRARDKLAKQRQDHAAFLESITDAEIDLILMRRQER